MLLIFPSLVVLPAQPWIIHLDVLLDLVTGIAGFTGSSTESLVGVLPDGLCGLLSRASGALGVTFGRCGVGWGELGPASVRGLGEKRRM